MNDGFLVLIWLLSAACPVLFIAEYGGVRYLNLGLPPAGVAVYVFLSNLLFPLITAPEVREYFITGRLGEPRGRAVDGVIIFFCLPGVVVGVFYSIVGVLVVTGKVINALFRKKRKVTAD
jgi:hypothetical protein